MHFLNFFPRTKPLFSYYACLMSQQLLAYSTPLIPHFCIIGSNVLFSSKIRKPHCNGASNVKQGSILLCLLPNFRKLPKKKLFFGNSKQHGVSEGGIKSFGCSCIGTESTSSKTPSNPLCARKHNYVIFWERYDTIRNKRRVFACI